MTIALQNNHTGGWLGLDKNNKPCEFTGGADADAKGGIIPLNDTQLQLMIVELRKQVIQGNRMVSISLEPCA